jgi:hypothetical protein
VGSVVDVAGSVTSVRAFVELDAAGEGLSSLLHATTAVPKIATANVRRPSSVRNIRRLRTRRTTSLSPGA